MQNGDEASPSILLAGLALLSSHWYEKGDEATPSIILAGQALLVKMLIALEPQCIFVQILYTYVF